MKIAIGSDRRGYDYKVALVKMLKELGYEIKDVGPYDDRYPVDYPIYGEKVGQEVAAGRCRYGVVVCATGIGIMMAANKVKGVRCGIAYTDDVARLMREHNDANVIAFGQSQMALEDVKRRLRIFLQTDFAGGYHRTRIKQLSDMECDIPITQTPFGQK